LGVRWCSHDYSLFFLTQLKSGWGKKTFWWVKYLPWGSAILDKWPEPSHLKHLLRHGLGPLLGDGDLRVGIEEDFNDLWHGRTGLQHLVMGNKGGSGRGACPRGTEHPPAAAGTRPTPPRSRLGWSPYEAGVGFVLACFGDLSTSANW